MAFAEKCTSEIPFVAHNFFGFDLFNFIKTYIAGAWFKRIKYWRKSLDTRKFW